MESLNTQLQPFFEWLLRTTVQASLLICLILLLQVVLRGRLGPRWCHALWLLLLIRMAMPWAPQSRASIFNLIPPSIPQRQTEYEQEELADEGLDSQVADKGTSDTMSVSTTPIPQETPKVTTEKADIRKKVSSQLKPAFFNVSNVLPLVWLAGVLALGVYICAANCALLRIVRRERPLTNQKMLDLLEDCKSQMSIRTILGLVITDKVTSPALFGFVRPRLLLPAGMLEALSLKELRHVFLHELAHLKRRDIYLGWLTCILQALHWFNPLIWLAFYRMRADRELACDYLVLARLTSGGLSRTQSSESKDYGRTVVNLLERFSRPRRLPAMAGILETKAQLKRRIKMIARFKKNSYQWPPLAVILIIILGFVSLPDAKRTKAAGTTATKTTPGVTLRRVEGIYEGGSGGFPSISFDGKYMCDVDWETCDLVARELATGKEQRLAESREYVTLNSAISRDSKRVAYIWSKRSKSDTKPLIMSELYVVGVDGLGQKLLLQGQNLYPRCWSPDDKKILGLLFAEDETVQIVWVSASDGSIEKIRPVAKDAYLSKFDVSPDGRYIAYDLPQAENDPKRDIFVLAFDVNREIPVVKHAANDRLLGWTPDGKSIFFASDRMGTWDGWTLNVVDGKPSGIPKLVKPQLGEIAPIGFTQDGSYYYTLLLYVWDVYTAKLDMGTGKVLSAPEPIRQAGSDGPSDWSPDGRYLAYIFWPSPSFFLSAERHSPGVIHIRTFETGQERKLETNLPFFRFIRWCPDGRSILAADFEKQGIYKIDSQTGEYSCLLESKTGGIEKSELSPDGKTLFYYGGGRGKGLVARELETGNEKQIFQSPAGQFGWVLSPDGQCLALWLRDQASWSLQVMPVTGGPPRELLKKKAEEQQGIYDVVWTPDGRGLLFTFGKAGDQGLTVTELWRISAEGGEPRKAWEWNKQIYALRVHPDGQHIAFGSGTNKSVVWVMENFLPTGEVNER